MADKMLTVSEVADKMSVHRRTVLNWIRDKKIPYTRIGNDYRIDPEDLKKFKVMS